ncbi:hypothetical protein BUE93_01035 [Chromobacterium amazonense]|uniref:Uncharacterized protein n=1 Tax=Chromobacterium amazonense TaxID=1382803 RepID=A0A2S9XAF3_9NEIS|nr:hypothetical protein [Chromobacterium amazonense]PRP72646.1 hypothetical protein BUE93_01035 [Chromobacterium amazonense]
MTSLLKKYLLWMFGINAILLFVLSLWTEQSGSACVAQWGRSMALWYAAGLMVPLNAISAIVVFTRFNIWRTISIEKIGLIHFLVSTGVMAIAAIPLLAGIMQCSPRMAARNAIFQYLQLLVNEQAFLICFLAFLVATGSLAKKYGRSI